MPLPTGTCPRASCGELFQLSLICRNRSDARDEVRVVQQAMDRECSVMLSNVAKAEPTNPPTALPDQVAVGRPLALDS